MDKGDRTKARMIDTAATLMRRQGYAATGLNQILESSQAPRGSLYFHFRKGKDELMAAALRAAGRAWQERLVVVLGRQAGVDLARDIDAVAGALAAELEDSGFVDGCPLATVTLETAATNETLRRVSADHFRAWEELIAARLDQAGVPAGGAPALATLLLCGFEGALILARAYHDTAPLRQVAAALKQVVAAQATSRRDAPPARRARSPRAPATADRSKASARPRPRPRPTRRRPAAGAPVRRRGSPRRRPPSAPRR